MEEKNLPEQVVSEVSAEITPVSNPPAEKSHFIQLFIALALLGVLFLGGTYWLIVSQKTAPLPPVAVKNTDVENQKDLTDMESELEASEPQDIDKEFVQVDQEMKNL